MRWGILIIALVMSLPAHSQGGDGAIVAQLVQVVSEAKKQLEELKKAVNISEHLEQLEQLKAIKKLSEDGKAIGGMFRDLQDIERLLGQFEEDPFGTQQTEREIARLEQRLEAAGNRDGLAEGAAYARLVADLKRIKFLGQAQEANLRRSAGGTNDSDNKAIAASSGIIMSDILLQREKREAVKRTQEVEAVSELLRATRYSQIKTVGEQ